MMMTAVNPGEKIAVPRNSHKSMLGGLVMSGAHPIYMQPEVDEELHMDHCVTPENGGANARRTSGSGGRLHRFADVLRRRRRPGVDRTNRPRRRQTVPRRRSLGPALSIPSGVADVGHASPGRHVHQLDAQNVVGVFAVRDVASNRSARAPRPPQSGAENVSFDLAELADGRFPRRRAQANGDRRWCVAFAYDRACRRNAAADQSDRWIILFRRRAAGPQGRLRFGPHEDRRDGDRPRIHRLRSVGNSAVSL